MILVFNLLIYSVLFVYEAKQSLDNEFWKRINEFGERAKIIVGFRGSTREKISIDVSRILNNRPVGDGISVQLRTVSQNEVWELIQNNVVARDVYYMAFGYQGMEKPNQERKAIEPFWIESLSFTNRKIKLPPDEMN
jgi:hypothetical protein